MLLTPHITKRTNARAVKKSWQRVQGVGNTTLLKTETKKSTFFRVLSVKLFYPSNSFLAHHVETFLRTRHFISRLTPRPHRPQHRDARCCRCRAAPSSSRHPAPRLTDAHHHRATRYNMQRQYVGCSMSRLVFCMCIPGPTTTAAGKQGCVKTERWREGRSFD